MKYSLYFAWFVVLVGLLGVLKFLGIPLLFVFLGLFVFHFCFLFISGFLAYKDGFSLAQFGYCVLLLLFFLFFLPLFKDWVSFFVVFRLFWVMTFVFVGFSFFLGSLFFGVPFQFLPLFFLLGLGMFSFLLFSLVKDVYWVLFLRSLFLGVVIYLFVRSSSYSPLSHQKTVAVSVRRILAGEKILDHSFLSRSWFSSFIQFVKDFPLWGKYGLEMFVLSPLVILVFFYFSSFGSLLFTDLHQFLYWGIIALFFGNILLLKQLGYKSHFQYFFLFFVVYFAFYVSLFSYFEGNVGSSVLWAMLWNLFLSLSFFLFPQKFPQLFEHKDFIYRICIAFVSMIINVLLLFQTSLAGQLIFFLSLLYVGLQGFLLFSVAKRLFKDSSSPVL